MNSVPRTPIVEMRVFQNEGIRRALRQQAVSNVSSRIVMPMKLKRTADLPILSSQSRRLADKN
jgi:hypothetical protein